MSQIDSEDINDSLSLFGEEVVKEEEDVKKDLVLLVHDQEGPLGFKVEDADGEEYLLEFVQGAKNHTKKITLGVTYQFMNLGFKKMANLTFKETSFLIKSETQIESKNKMMTTKDLLGKKKFQIFRKKINLKLLKMNEEKLSSKGARYKYCVAGDKVSQCINKK